MVGWTVHWVAPDGAMGEGTQPLNARLAVIWVSYLNRRLPDWQHWLEKVES